MVFLGTWKRMGLETTESDLLIYPHITFWPQPCSAVLGHPNHKPHSCSAHIFLLYPNSSYRKSCWPPLWLCQIRLTSHKHWGFCGPDGPHTLAQFSLHRWCASYIDTVSSTSPLCSGLFCSVYWWVYVWNDWNHSWQLGGTQQTLLDYNV